jgi:hypothetical protein
LLALVDGCDNGPECLRRHFLLLLAGFVIVIHVFPVLGAVHLLLQGMLPLATSIAVMFWFVNRPNCKLLKTLATPKRVF